VAGPPDESGQLGDVDVNLLAEAEAHYAADSDWWPRAYLDLRGRLRARARDGQEAQRFFSMLLPLVEQGVFSDHSRWSTGEIVAGAIHRVRLEWNNLAVLRVVAKIAYATAALSVSPSALDSDHSRRVCLFVGGHNDDDASIVSTISEAGTITEWPEHNLALIFSNEGRVQAIIVLYGACFIVDLGSNPIQAFPKSVLAMSRTSGTKTYVVKDDEANEIAKKLEEYVKVRGHSGEQNAGVEVARSNTSLGQIGNRKYRRWLWVLGLTSAGVLAWTVYKLTATPRRGHYR
jgi:hypothetical protein